jgi:hypothetical protein
MKPTLNFAQQSCTCVRGRLMPQISYSQGMISKNICSLYNYILLIILRSENYSAAIFAGLQSRPRLSKQFFFPFYRVGDAYMTLYGNQYPQYIETVFWRALFALRAKRMKEAKDLSKEAIALYEALPRQQETPTSLFDVSLRYAEFLMAASEYEKARSQLAVVRSLCSALSPTDSVSSSRLLETLHLSALSERDHRASQAVQYAKEALSVLDKSPQAKDVSLRFQFEVREREKEDSKREEKGGRG